MTQDRQVEIAADRDDRDSFIRLLGGRGSAVDASLPPIAFGLGWFLGGESIAIGGGAAVVVGALIAGWRLQRGARPLAVLISLLAVLVGALIALYTGDAADFFLPRLASNVLSALVWMISIVIRWPLLGVVVGAALGQARRWRRDPVLLRAYSRASWVWVGQYMVRLVVFIPLWLLGATGALTIAQVVLTWPLVAVCMAASWWVVRRSLPPEHPGLRHPRS
ncbi:DUF3159 domain-containing protein [Saccharopolyspora sp. ASAGF58]|uniref:DUF3159 domain-containing protein n=1 Tax=Saccharopolyspora sp. ASAGF58 TaxID=2719023 RepID=UPI00144012B3|nr:DUF3159 domain-containing protein [Saccharopolyspora sp. ASAGF58]QIZ35639.1 DUF3159 domain-containing protein [Saccharopolyspora sp. ASAGF58]